jgi:hypothetical protein
MAEAERTGLPGVAVQLGATTAQGKAGERQAAIDSAFASQCVSEATAVLDCDPTVCAVCDRLILKPENDTRLIFVEDIPDSWKERLKCPDVDLDDDLAAQYACSEMHVGLTGMMLSPRGLVVDEKYGEVQISVCNTCYGPLQHVSPTMAPPQLAIANFNFIGQFPSYIFHGETDKFLYDIEAELLSPLLEGGVRHVHLDKVDDEIRNTTILKGHTFCVESNLSDIADAVYRAPSGMQIRAHVGSHLTPTEKLLVRRAFPFRRAVYLCALQYVSKHNVKLIERGLDVDLEAVGAMPDDGYADVFFTEEKGPEDMSNKTATDISLAYMQCKAPAAGSDTQHMASLMDGMARVAGVPVPSDDAAAPNEDTSPAGLLLVRRGNRYANGNNKELLPLLFSAYWVYGRGGPDEPRLTPMSFETLISRVTQLSTGQFQGPQVQLSLNNMRDRANVVKSAYIQGRSLINVGNRLMARAEAFGRLDQDQLAAAVKYASACAHAQRTGGECTSPTQKRKKTIAAPFLGFLFF